MIVKILELKNTMSEMGENASDLIKQKESVKSVTSLLKLSSLKEKKEEASLQDLRDTIKFFPRHTNGR